MRRAIAAGLAVALLPLAASAHVTVWPRQSEAGARERYAIRVPNERRIATVRLEAEFPAEVRVNAFEQVAGWSVEVRRDDRGAIVGAVWTGSLPADQFVELGVLAINPAAGAAMTWRFVQVYADGTRVAWTGPPGSQTPAPVVELKPAAGR